MVSNTNHCSRNESLSWLLWLPCSLPPPWAWVVAVGIRPTSLTPTAGELWLFCLSLQDDAPRAAEPQEYRDFDCRLLGWSDAKLKLVSAPEH